MRIQQILENIELDEVTYDDIDKFNEDYGVMWYNEDDILDEAEYQGRNVKLGKPMAGDVKKFKVYVKNPKGNVVKVNFGQKGVKIKKSLIKIKRRAEEVTRVKTYNRRDAKLSESKRYGMPSGTRRV